MVATTWVEIVVSVSLVAGIFDDFGMEYIGWFVRKGLLVSGTVPGDCMPIPIENPYPGNDLAVQFGEPKLKMFWKFLCKAIAILEKSPRISTCGIVSPASKRVPISPVIRLIVVFSQSKAGPHPLAFPLSCGGPMSFGEVAKNNVIAASKPKQISRVLADIKLIKVLSVLGQRISCDSNSPNTILIKYFITYLPSLIPRYGTVCNQSAIASRKC